MKLNTKMPERIKPHFKHELDCYYSALNKSDLVSAWSHLERAHIIGQLFPCQHSYIHWKMLQFGMRIKSPKEVIGQIPRLLIGGVKSFVGKIPTGNPGGANVPALKSFPIPADLEKIIYDLH